MSISAAVLFDRALKQTRRAALREQGLIPRPLPQIRIVRWLRAPRETYAAWSLMLLENVRSLDEAVEEVREERQAKLDAKVQARSADRRERAELKAISRGGVLARTRGGRQVPALTAGAGDGQPASEPALAEAALTDHAVTEGAPAGSDATRSTLGRSALEPAALSASPRRTAVGGSRSASDSIDLTAEDDTLALPKLDSPSTPWSASCAPWRSAWAEPPAGGTDRPPPRERREGPCSCEQGPSRRWRRPAVSACRPPSAPVRPPTPAQRCAGCAASRRRGRRR